MQHQLRIIFAVARHQHTVANAAGGKELPGPAVGRDDLRLPQKAVQRHGQRHRQDKQRQINGDTRHADQKIIPAIVSLKIAGIDRHGLGPAEAQEHQTERADGIQMLPGVQRQPPQHLGGGVAAAIGHVAVGDLVQDQRQKHGNGEIQQIQRKAQRIGGQPIPPQLQPVQDPHARPLLVKRSFIASFLLIRIKIIASGPKIVKKEDFRLPVRVRKVTFSLSFVS